jgi:dTDP-4-dehydrorhamnose 3,5-epimerase
MNITSTPIEGLLIVEPRVIPDDRGYFFESYNYNTLEKATGVKARFVQDNQAKSSKNVLRGLHYQNAPHAQTKFIRVLYGTIWDVVLDIRKSSKTFGQWFGIELSAENKKQFYIPQGFAHGYAVLSNEAEVFYKCDDFYSKADEGGIFYADPALQIDWKIDLKDAIISEKDMMQPMLTQANNKF